MSKYDGLGLSEEEIAAMEDEIGEESGAEVEAEGTEEEAVVEEESAAEKDSDESVAGESEPVADEDEAKEDEPNDALKAAAKEYVEKVKEEPVQPVADKATLALDKLNADLADLKKQFDEGEISIDEYIDAKSALDRQIVKAELKAELAQESANKSWEQSQKDFLGQNAYLRDSEVLYDAFAMQVNKLLADPKSASMSDADLLAAAKVKVDAAIGRQPDAEPSTKKDESPIRKAKKEAADVSKAPKTLQGIPAAAPADDVDGNRFAYLDRLTGEAFEAAIAKLSDEDRGRWARSQ
jgi:hypothetical protein